MKREKVVVTLLVIVIVIALLTIAITLYREKDNHGIPIQDLRNNSSSK